MSRLAVVVYLYIYDLLGCLTRCGPASLIDSDCLSKESPGAQLLFSP